MARVEAGILFVVLPALIVFGLIMLARYLGRRRMQAYLARTAPDLLRFEDINPEIRKHIIAQRQALNEANTLMNNLLDDPVVLIPSEYADPIQNWISSYPKEIS